MPADRDGPALSDVASTCGTFVRIKPTACMDIFGGLGACIPTCVTTPSTAGTTSIIDVTCAIDALEDAWATRASGPGDVAMDETPTCVMGAVACKAGVIAATGAANGICTPGTNETDAAVASSDTGGADCWGGTASPTDSASAAGAFAAIGHDCSTDSTGTVELSSAPCGVSVP